MAQRESNAQTQRRLAGELRRRSSATADQWLAAAGEIAAFAETVDGHPASTETTEALAARLDQLR